MADETPHSDRLHWTGGWNSEPVWPCEPDIEVVRSLAKQHLIAELPAPLDDSLLVISFFAQGGFNKLYQISYKGHHTSYLLRVALPIEPYYKTESEVATIAYLRANTSIPVPQVFAWNSNSKNELRFEWILMAKIDGIPLIDVWRKVPWERKLKLTETIAEMVKQLRTCKFDRMGGLYFKSAVERGPNKLGNTDGLNSSLINLAVTKSPTADLESHSDRHQDESTPSALGNSADGEDAQVSVSNPAAVVEPLRESEAVKPESVGDETEFCVDRVFDPLFFMASRLYLPGNRGPYQSSLEWLSAEIQVQLEWIRNGPVEGDEDYTSDFVEEAPMMERLCPEYLKNLQTVFGDEEKKDSFTLHHSDLNAANILVHPETFEIKGIVDWEMINVAPEWKASEHPKFLQYMEPEDEEEPPIPSYEDESDIAVYIRDRWENRILRRHFDDAMKRLTGDADVVVDTLKTKAKRDCHELIPELTGMWNWSAGWLRTYKRTGVSKNGADRAKEVKGENDSEAED